jgi:hypothetical protein
MALGGRKSGKQAHSHSQHQLSITGQIFLQHTEIQNLQGHAYTHYTHRKLVLIMLFSLPPLFFSFCDVLRFILYLFKILLITASRLLFYLFLFHVHLFVLIHIYTPPQYTYIIFFCFPRLRFEALYVYTSFWPAVFIVMIATRINLNLCLVPLAAVLTLTSMGDGTFGCRTNGYH